MTAARTIRFTLNGRPVVAQIAMHETLVEVLKKCGDDLTRENLMKQAASLNNLQLPLALPGVTISTSADDYAPFQSMQLMKFDGKEWVRFGEVLKGR